MGATIGSERRGQVVLITIGGDGGGDQLDADSVDQLRRATLSLTDAPPRAVIVTGTLRSFCTGLELSLSNPLMKRLELLAQHRDAFAIQETLRGIRGILTGLGRIPCPVIAAIEGPCLDAGLDLALSCDLRVASREAALGFPGITHGMVPLGGGLVQLHRLLGRGRAAKIALSGEAFSAAQALELGLVSELCAPGEAVARAEAIAQRLLQMSPAAVQQTVLALRRLDGSTDDLDIETQSAARAINSGELFRGLRGT